MTRHGGEGGSVHAEQLQGGDSRESWEYLKAGDCEEARKPNGCVFREKNKEFMECLLRRKKTLKEISQQEAPGEHLPDPKSANNPQSESIDVLLLTRKDQMQMHRCVIGKDLETSRLYLDIRI